MVSMTVDPRHRLGPGQTGRWRCGGESMGFYWRLVVAIGLAAALAGPICAGQDGDWEAAVARGVVLRIQGQLQESIESLAAAVESAPTPAGRARAEGELGIALLQARDLAGAEPLLQRAHAFHEGRERARYALYLGNLAQARQLAKAAEDHYREAMALAPTDVEIQLSAGLNRARLAPEGARLQAVRDLATRLDAAGDDPRWARLHLNLAHQAWLLGKAGGRTGQELAYRHGETARRLAAAGDPRVEIEALDFLAQIYEDQGRPGEALILDRRGIALAEKAPTGLAADLLIGLEWRQARLLQAANDEEGALAGYMRAVSRIEAVRQDIPIEYEDGRSSFRATLEPIYLGYADLLLRRLDSQPTGVREARLQAVVEAVELIRQSELQDFLGDRCSVEAVQGGISRGLPAGTAVLYPLVFADRLELLLKTNGGIERRSVAVPGSVLRKVAVEFADTLRNGLPDPLARSRQLDGWLLAPFADRLSQLKVDSLVVVPDGPLRLVPMAALNDGQSYAIERFAVSLVTGLSLTNSGSAPRRDTRALVMGMAEPGPVVGKLDAAMTDQVLAPGSRGASSARGLAATRTLRAIRGLETAQSGVSPDRLRQLEDWRTRLALPGVRDEVRALAGILEGANLLDSDFTLGRLRQEAASGDFRIVHIASHGIFGGSADSSFIMAYDDLLRVNDLQALLKTEKFQQAPIELLTLSACETAEGNDRAPLGISGAAIKARAKSVVGTLWPVEDNAAKALMRDFYQGIAHGGMTKAEALRRAQLALLRNAEFRDPFYWAPFVLIGNWQ